MIKQKIKRDFVAGINTSNVNFIAAISLAIL